MTSENAQMQRLIIQRLSALSDVELIQVDVLVNQILVAKYKPNTI